MSEVTEQETYNETVRENIRNNSLLHFDYLLMNTLATIIACYGLFADSPAVVIGAMVIAMLLNPISGTALALVDSDMALLRKALTTLGAGILGIMLTAFFIGLMHSNIPLTHEIIGRTAPNLLDLMIALSGGAAGAYATVSARISVAFVGVAIATALVPPLASSGILLARGELHLAFGAFLLTFTNIIAIQVASSVVMWSTGFHRVVRKFNQVEFKTFFKNNLASLLILAILAVSLTTNLHDVISKQVYENNVRKILLKEIDTPTSFSDLAEIRFEKLPNKSIIRATVRGIAPLTATQVKTIETKLPSISNDTVNELRILFLQTLIINRDGIVHNDIELGTQN